VAVDITEQTAAKTALQNAAAGPAERIIPKLAGQPERPGARSRS
jgi:hypothetical protein